MALGKLGLIDAYDNLGKGISRVYDFHIFFEARQTETRLLAQLRKWKDLLPAIDALPEYQKRKEEELKKAQVIYKEAKDRTHYEKVRQGLSFVKAELDNFVNLKWLERNNWSLAADIGLDMENTAIMRSLNPSSIGDLVDKAHSAIIKLENEAAEQRRICAIFEREIEQLKDKQSSILREILGPIFPEPQVIDLEEVEIK